MTNFKTTFGIIFLGIALLFFGCIFAIIIDVAYENSRIEEGCINLGYETYIGQDAIRYCIDDTHSQQVITDCEGWFGNKQCNLIPIGGVR